MNLRRRITGRKRGEGRLSVKDTTIYKDLDILHKMIAETPSCKPKYMKRPVYMELCPKVLEIKKEYSFAYNNLPTLDDGVKKVEMLRMCLALLDNLKDVINDVYRCILYSNDECDAIMGKINVIDKQFHGLLRNVEARTKTNEFPL